MLRAKTLKITALAGLTFLILVTLSIIPQLKLPTQTYRWPVTSALFMAISQSGRPGHGAGTNLHAGISGSNFEKPAK